MITEIKDLGIIRGEETYYCDWKAEKEYSIQIKLIPESKEISSFNCTCPYASFYGQSKKNEDGKKLCRHVVKAYAMIMKVTYQKAREILIEHGELNPTHLIKP